jgi:protein SCO1/2
MHHYSCIVSRRAFRLAPFIVCTVIVASAFTACSGTRAEEHRYDLKGKVLAVDHAAGTVTVDHQDIVGYMPAMQMAFPLRDADALQDVQSGDQIQATLVVTDKDFWLENPFITKGLPDGVNPSMAVSGGGEPQPGAEVPDAALVNQDGKRISLRQYRGRALLVTFVYTRCPLPDYCPLLSTKFAEINGQLEAEPALGARTHLLSVTLDPEYDKPEVLRRYGTTYAGGKFDRWEFATGDPSEVRRLAQFFGLTYEVENGQVIHSLRTAIITPDGKLYQLFHGNEWKPAEVFDELKSSLVEGHNASTSPNPVSGG